MQLGTCTQQKSKTALTNPWFSDISHSGITAHSGASTKAISQEQKEGLALLPSRASKVFSESAKDPVIKLVPFLYGIEKRNQVTMGVQVFSLVQQALTGHHPGRREGTVS